MSIIKPGDIRVDVLGISKIKQQGGRWRVRRVGEKKIGKKKKNKLSSHFWKRNRRRTKETTQKTKPGRRNVFDF